jgi:hypothetical protein
MSRRADKVVMHGIKCVVVGMPSPRGLIEAGICRDPFELFSILIRSRDLTSNAFQVMVP